MPIRTRSQLLPVQAPRQCVELWAGAPICCAAVLRDEYFMALAFLSAQRSKDPNKQVLCCLQHRMCCYHNAVLIADFSYAWLVRQVGAVLVSQENIILGIGYNGFPRGCSDEQLPWAKLSRNSDVLDTK